MKGKEIFKRAITAVSMAAILACMPGVATVTNAGTFLEAQYVGIGSEYSGTLVYGEREMWYSFQTGASDAYYYLDAKNYSTKSCSFYLKSDSSKTVTSVSVSSGNQKSTSMKLLTANTTYYVRVSGSPSKTQDISYGFTVNQILDDAGNTPDTSKAVVVDQTVYGSHEVRGDIDYYRFQTGIAGVYAIEATNHTSRSKSFAIYNEYNKTVGSFSVQAGSTVKYDKRMLDANSFYYLKVSSGEEGDYEFRIESPIDDCGNTAADATMISMGQKQSGLIDYKKDVDYWQFTTGEASVYRILAENSGVSSIRFYLYNADELKMSYQFSSLSGNKSRETCVSLEPNSTYYIAISSSYENIPYALEVEPIVDEYADEWEAASTIQLQKKYNGVIANKDDSDWLRFTSTKTAKYYMSREGSGVRFDLYRMDSDGDLTRVSSGSTAKTVTLQKGDSYYIRLYSSSKWNSYKYSFKIVRK